MTYDLMKIREIHENRVTEHDNGKRFAVYHCVLRCFVLSTKITHHLDYINYQLVINNKRFTS